MSKQICETDFTNHYCDGCGSENPLYHMLGSSESIDYCRSCYSKSPAERCRPNRHEGTCDICYQSMNPGQGYEFCFKHRQERPQQSMLVTFMDQA